MQSTVRHLCFLLLVASVSPEAVFGFEPGPLDVELRVGDRVASEVRLNKNEMLVGASVGYYAGTSFLFPGDDHTALAQQTSALYGINDLFQVRADIVYLRSSNSQVQPETLSSFGDTHFSTRFPVWDAAGLRFGAEAGIHFFAGLPDRTDFLDGASLSMRQTGSGSFGRFRVHYNLGYFYDRSAGVMIDVPTIMESTAYGFGEHSQVLGGIRAEAAYGAIYPYVEYAGRYPVGGEVGTFQGPQWLTPGFAFRFGEAGSVGLSFPIGLTSTKAPGLQTATPWTLQASVGWYFDDIPYKLRQLVAPEPSVVKIRAVDGVDNGTLPDAVVTLYGPDGPVQSEGTLSWSGHAQKVTYSASLPHYLPATGATSLRGGQLRNVTLTLTPNFGWVKGVLANRSGTEAVQLYLNDTASPVHTGRGKFELTLAPGRYSGYATAPNAVSTAVNFVLGIGQTVSLPRLEVFRPKPVVPVIKIPELPPEESQERKSAVLDLIRQLEEQNEKVRQARDEEAVNVGFHRDAPRQKEGLALEEFEEGLAVADFQTGSWILDIPSQRRLQELADLVEKSPSKVDFIIIQGSADDIGSMEVNTAISEKRARAVFEALQAYGVPAEKMGMKISVFTRSPSAMPLEAKQAQRQVSILVSTNGSGK